MAARQVALPCTSSRYRAPSPPTAAASSWSRASAGAGGAGKRSWTGRGVDAVTVTTVCPPGSRRAMTRTADLPTGDSDSCRNAVRADSGRGRQPDVREQFPGAQLVAAVAGDEVGGRHVAAAPAGTAQQQHPVEGAGEGGHRAGGQRQADVPADGGDVVHLERAEERVAALPGERRGRRAGRAGRLPAGELSERAGRGDQHAVAGLPHRGPAESLQVKQPGHLRLRLGEQEGPAAEPGVAVPPRGIRGRRELGDAVQVHQVSPCPAGQCSSSSSYASPTRLRKHVCWCPSDSPGS